ncbi:MaoC/PaaZ C-terminal domain-containing protein [Streptomyces wedmorensis]|uniref:MaoC/PaaZ C-terminal domain-containing protein n=1 Tax=Streptomyces wedmorensis TaxID=43759 RepID=UPI0037A6DEE4
MSHDDLLTIPREARRFEDFAPGWTHEHPGHIRVSEKEILAFARAYDLHSLHTDPRAAAEGPYGGLIASGWHGTALMARLLTEHYLPRGAGLGGLGSDELRWQCPIRPGDTLRLRLTVEDALPHPGRSDCGVLRLRPELVNQHDDAALTMSLLVLMKRRSAP